jgi:hypothetical protein
MAFGVVSFVTPVGNVAPSLNGGNFAAPFANSAQFSCGSGETCAAGEYRQYVKGEFTVNGSVLTHYLCAASGMTLSAAVFQEDGCPPPGCTAFGYRRCPQWPYNQYVPDRATGCAFRMYDQPGFTSVQRGMTYGINLAYKAVLINAVTGAVLQSHVWTVVGQVTTQEEFGALQAAGFQPTDKISAVRTGRNSDNGMPELHVIVLRQLDQPPLDPASLGLELIDADDRLVVPSSPFVAHEIAGRDSATATLVATLPSDSHAPVKAAFTSLSGEPALQALPPMDVDIR